jgi:hypothetical protein
LADGSSCSIENGVNFDGGDLHPNGKFSAADIESCCSRCNASPMCFFFTFNPKAGADCQFSHSNSTANEAGCCNLKGRSGWVKKTDASAVSGTKGASWAPKDGITWKYELPPKVSGLQV